MFNGLKIMKTGEYCLKHMGVYPVIQLSLKSAKQSDFGLAYTMIIRQIAAEYRRHSDIMDELPSCDIERFVRILAETGDEKDYIDSIAFLMHCLKRSAGQKCILLIDEYDVPLENAYFAGFYDEMSGFIRSLFESSLKSNSDIEFAVITGCLRITKESIFTGLNNLKAISILNDSYGEYFGFIQKEVDELLQYYDREIMV